MYTGHARAGVNRKQIAYAAVGCLVTENSMDMAKSTTEDKVEPLLKVYISIRK